MVSQRPSPQRQSSGLVNSLTIAHVKQPTADVFPSPASTSALRGPILVVDGDAAVLRVLRLVLEGAGYSCIGCAGVEDATRLAERYKPLLVLAEVRLAGPGGQELARRLTDRDGVHPHVALMSAYPRPRPGAEDSFVPKPIEFDRLLHLLDVVERERAG
jgi:DNA-binding NtrC family response regulator